MKTTTNKMLATNRKNKKSSQLYWEHNINAMVRSFQFIHKTKFKWSTIVSPSLNITIVINNKPLFLNIPEKLTNPFIYYHIIIKKIKEHLNG